MKVEWSGCPADRPPLDLLAVGIFEDERPIRGMGGVVDWRLAGRLSAAVTGGSIRGAAGEMALLLPGGRFAGTRVLIQGLGDSSHFTARAFDRASRALRDAVAGLGARSAAAGIPGFHRVAAWDRKASLAPSDAVASFVAGLSGLTSLLLLVEEGGRDEVILGCHKARALLKDKNITLELPGGRGA